MNSGYPPLNSKQKASNLLQKGRAENALKLLLKVNKKSPDDTEALYLIGKCYQLLGRYKDSIKVFEKSLQLQPQDIQSHLAIGTTYNMLNMHQQAMEYFKAITDKNPNTPAAHLALGDSLGILRNYESALLHYNKARTLQPAVIISDFGLGIIAEQQNKIEDALTHFQKAVKSQPKYIPYLCSMAQSLEKVRRWQEASGTYKKVLRFEKENADALGGLMRICDITGEYSKAEKHINQLLHKNIHNITACIAFLHICKHLKRCDEAIEYAYDVLAKDTSMPANTRQFLHMATARSLDHMKRYKEAFIQLQKGKELSTRQLPYDPGGHKLTIDNIINTFNPAMFMQTPRAQTNTQRPIFIVGMPRSGTSLTEQILAAHPDVEGAGELTDLADLMKTLASKINSKKHWPQCVSDLKQDHIDHLSNQYLEKLKTVSKKAQYITDKMPHNFYLLGLIQVLFPQAHIIHCCRNSMDTCLSIYLQNFQESHAYANNLFNLGSHYHQYQRLMTHWKQVLTIPVFDLHYEELVSNPEKTIRNMLKFCNMEWDDNCLQFHSIRRNIKTASYDQVRQPLYSHSINRWQHYESGLKDLKEGLERGY